MPFTTSDRRNFERDIYDFGRSLGLSKRQARHELRKARAFCGEESYDSDHSAWEDEIDDSPVTLGRFSNIIEQMRVKVPGDPVCSLNERKLSSMPNVTQETKEENQVTSNFDLEKITTATEIKVPESSLAMTAKTEIAKSKKRKSVGTDVVFANVKEHVEKRTRQEGTTRIWPQCENATQAVQPASIDEDQKRRVRKDKKKKKSRARSSNTQTESVSLLKLDSEKEKSRVDPDSKVVKRQILRSDSPREENSDKAENVKMDREAVGKRGNSAKLCQRSKQGSIENKGNRTASHQGFSSPMI